jgi:hypothetical protein
MAPDASSMKKLVYVSIVDKGVVDVYNYKTGARVGQLSGFASPQGQCVDAKGDVFITDYANTSVTEYAHGGLKPLKILQTDGSPIACSVSASGDLSVADEHTDESNQSQIVIFKDASGSPTVYTNSSCYIMFQQGYEPRRQPLRHSGCVCVLLPDEGLRNS